LVVRVLWGAIGAFAVLHQKLAQCFSAVQFGLKTAYCAAG